MTKTVEEEEIEFQEMIEREEILNNEKRERRERYGTTMGSEKQ
jgi:hypothetical protein